MWNTFLNLFRKRRDTHPIDPDEIFLDSKNLPDFDMNQFEGRIEKPISKRISSIFSFTLIIFACIFVWKLWGLQVVQGATYRDKSENNRLRHTTIFADRGTIYDRNGAELVWNTVSTTTSEEYSLRQYVENVGLGTLLGYVKYPSKDTSGVYYQEYVSPKDGMEKYYDALLRGTDGKNIIETDARGTIISQSVIDPPKSGTDLNLSIDLGLQKNLYQSMLLVAEKAGYKGGAGVIMDIQTGQVLASATFPEYDSQVMTDGKDTQKIQSWLTSKNNPFLNRVIAGSYTPGSIVKPFVAMGVLDQGVISPTRQILSTGSISVPNPYDHNKPSVFNDWKAHGLVDLRHAIAVSSNVYFYEVTGGFEGQKGIGIDNLEKYVRMFGFGTTTGVEFFGERKGTIPDPAWKASNFQGEEWRVGDTYNTAIGQYGFQVTPLQVVRGIAAIANGGLLLVPTYRKDAHPEVVGKASLSPDYYTIVREGMRLCVTDGTCKALNVPYVAVAAKTGTAQIGLAKDEVNSWTEGFWPYTNPKYAFVVVMERGSKNNQFGSVLVWQNFFNTMSTSTRHYMTE